MERITSAQNPKIKQLAQLCSERRTRLAAGQFVAEGLRLCEEALCSGIVVEETYYTAAAARRYGERLEKLLMCSVQSTEVAEELTHKFSDTRTPQGVYCLCRVPADHAFICREGGRYLALENLQDPGNVGTVLRSAEALGMDAVILTRSCPDRFGPKVLRSSMGSVFRLPCVIVENLADFIRSQPFVSFAACLDAGARPLTAIHFSGTVLAAVGNEGKGLSDETISACGEKLFIDMFGPTESLNASAAASILMWEMAKQRNGG